MNSRDMILDIARGFLGAVQGDAKHRLIVDTYNGYVTAEKGKAHKGSTYKVKYSDAWCATFVSTCAIMAKDTDIIPTECSCTRMINLFKQMGCFEPNDNHVPKPADIIFYKWDGITSEEQDVDGVSNHVGIVEACDGKTITVIEGNKEGKCARRTIKVGWKYIHGFGLPKYADSSAQKPQEKPSNIYKVKLGDNLSKIAKKANTTVEKILQLNPEIKNPNVIFVGQEIKLPWKI